MIVVIVGPPGAGKSSQSELLKDREHIEWLYVGKLLRAQSDAGIKAAVESGRLVDDDVVNNLVAGYIERIAPSQVIVIDGFPRHLPQAEWLVEHAAQSHHRFVGVVHLTLPRNEAQQRLQLRGREDDAPAIFNERYDIYERDIAPVIDYFRQVGITVHTIDGNRTEEAVFADIDKLLSDVHQS